MIVFWYLLFIGCFGIITGLWPYLFVYGWPTNDFLQVMYGSLIIFFFLPAPIVGIVGIIKRRQNV